LVRSGCLLVFLDEAAEPVVSDDRGRGLRRRASRVWWPLGGDLPLFS